MASIYEMARQRIAGAKIKSPTKKVSLSECGHLVNYPPPKGGELLVFASTEPLVLTQQNREA